MEAQFEKNQLPKYQLAKEHGPGHFYEVLCPKSDLQSVPQDLRSDFETNGQATLTKGKHKTFFLTAEKASQATITADSSVRASAAVASHKTYLGDLTNLLSSAYVFNRKQVPHKAPTITVVDSTPEAAYLISLSQTRNQMREWGNGRGDVQGTPRFFRDICVKFAAEHHLKITIIEGDDLLKQNFRLMHAVGRASINKPVFVNMAYKGNPHSDKWTAFVGKGLCFDTGGLNIKTAAGMFDMFMDKLGGMTVLAAFQTIVKERLPINLTCSIGLVENSINENAYRPSDIIQSRKGLTVEIGNTDAEGRLVLADCMHWTQQHFSTTVLIQLSTLTGAMITALGHSTTGLFTNDDELSEQLIRLGETVNETCWRLPCNKYHLKLISPKHCDLTNNSGQSEAGSSQAAAFLKEFAEPGVKWVHLDIAGTSMIRSAATGWGSRLLVEYARKGNHKDQQNDHHKDHSHSHSSHGHSHGHGHGHGHH